MCIQRGWEGWKGENEEGRNSQLAEGETGETGDGQRGRERRTMLSSYELHLILPLAHSYLNVPHDQHSAPSTPLRSQYTNPRSNTGCSTSRRSSFQLRFNSQPVRANSVAFQCSLLPAHILSVRMCPPCPGLGVCIELSSVCSAGVIKY